MKLVILDRDGVINHDSDQFIKNPDEWKPIPGSLEAIARLTQADFRVVVATNQSGVGRGLFDMPTLNPALLKEDAEKDLYQAILDITPMAKSYLEQGKYGKNLKTLVTLKPFIDDFFTQVMVMADDKALRVNRGALLQQLGVLMNQVADISRLVV